MIGVGFAICETQKGKNSGSLQIANQQDKKANGAASGRTTHFAHAKITRSVSEGVSTNHRSN